MSLFVPLSLVILLSSWSEIDFGLERKQSSFIFTAADTTDLEKERWNDAWEEREMLSELFAAPSPPLTYRMSNGRDMPQI
eukprot:12836003-Ditylum_brightwellii.AAC.1